LTALALALAAACSKPTADDHLKKADQYMASSQVDEAIIEYRSALSVDQKRGDIWTKLGDAYVEKRDGGNAYRAYIRAADVLPDDATAQIKAGNFLLIAKQFEDAKTRASNVLARDAKNVDAQILLGNAQAGLNNFDEALNEYHAATTLNPTDDRAYSNTGVLQALGQKAEAEASFRKAVEVAPKSIAAHMALFNFLWSSGRPADAEGELKAALEIDPKNLLANRALGAFYMASGRLKEAEPYFQTIAEQSKSADGTLALADYYVVAKRNADARQALQDLAANPKSFAVATTRLAAIDAIEGSRAQAHEKLRQVIDKYPKDMSARLMDARLLLVDGKREDALTKATAIVTEEPTAPESAQAYMLIGGVQASLDKFEAAIKAYEEAIKRLPQPIAPQLALAAVYLKAHEFDKAQTYLQQAQTIQPKNPVARSLKVRLLIAQRKGADAKVELASLQKDYPNAPEVLVLVGAQQFSERQFDAARASYTKALQASPSNIEAVSGLIMIDLASGHTAAALSRVEAGLKSSPPSSDLYLLAARTYAAARDKAKTEEYLNKAIEADPARLEAYALLAAFYASQGQLASATDQYRKIVERTPDSVASNTVLAMLLEAQHQVPEAEKLYQKVLTLNPRAAVAANNLAWLYVSSNRNLDEALQLAQTALQQLPDEPHVMDTLGWIYYRKDMAGRAVQYLESSVKSNPNDPAGHYHLGMAYVRAGEIDKGKQALQKALSFKVEFDGTAEARKTLAQLGG